MTESDFYNKMLLPCARVLAHESGGSGTVIYSQKTDGGYSTYLLTNHHVVSGLINLKNEWDSLLKRSIKKDFLETAKVHFFEYQWESRDVGYIAVDADILAYDKGEDLALLHLRGGKKPPGVAKLYTRGEERKLRIGDRIICLGCGLLEPPIFTDGRLSVFNREIENRSYFLTTAASIFGNSGGSIYLEKTGEFLGVPARIAVTGLFGMSAVEHMSYAVPITRVYQFLDDQMFRFIYDDAFTEESEEENRKKKREEEKMRMMVEAIE